MAWSWKGLNEAKRHLIVRGAIVLVTYELAFGGTFYWVEKGHLSGPVLMWMAVPPTLAVAAFILVIGRYLKEEADEYHRELVVRCNLWGLAAVMVVMAFHGFLQLFGWTGSWPVFVDLGAYFFAMLIAKLTYKVANRVPVDA